MEKAFTEKVISIVRQAGRIVLDADFEVYEKGSCVNIVTSSDIAVQSFLEKELTQLLPQSGFFGEESSPREAQRPLCWIVDPIDGTQNFSRNLRQSAISVALRQDDEVVLGVVYNPFLDEMYHAVKGEGSYLNSKRIHVSEKSFEDSLFCTALCCYQKQYAKVCSDIILDAYQNCNDVRRFGACSVELCLIASGRADLYFEYCLAPWDYAASSLILTEAGGSISNPVGELSLYSPSMVIAANSRQSLERLCGICKKHLS